MARALRPYEGLSKYYDLIYTREVDYDRDVEVLEALMETYGDGEIRRVIDLGCGTGQHAIRLALRGYMVVGVDSSPDMIRAARENARRARVPVKLIVQDVRELDLDGQIFDAALSLFGSFSYLVAGENLEDFFTGLRRVLRVNGLLILDYHDRTGTPREYRGRAVWEVNGKTIVRYAVVILNEDTGILRADYTFHVLEDETPVDSFKETHTLKTYTVGELRRLLARHGFKLLDRYKWQPRWERLERARSGEQLVRAVAIRRL